MDGKQSEEFLQGFACGWCLVIDMMRAKGMEELPHPAAMGMVSFADASEGYFMSSGLGKLLGPYHTREIRDALLKDLLAASGPAPGIAPRKEKVMNYRAIYLGNDGWAVRRFSEGKCDEVQFIMKVADPQARSSDKAAIERAKTMSEFDWRRV